MKTLRDQRFLVLLIGTPVSLLLGTLAYFLGDGGFATSLIIVLLGVAISLLLEIYLLVSEESAALRKLLPISASLFADKDLLSAVKDIVRSFTVLLESPEHELFRSEATHALTSCREAMVKIAEGNLPISEERRMKVMIDLIEKAEAGQRIYATSYVNLNDWWNKEVGRRYLKVNFAAAERGVRIQRIFIVRPDEEKYLRSFMEGQQQQGIEVKVVRENTLRPELKENFLILAERHLLTHSEYSRDGELIRGYICCDDKTFDEYGEKFDLLRYQSVALGAFYAD